MKIAGFSPTQPPRDLFLVHDVYEKDKIKSGLKVKYFELQVIDCQNGDKVLTDYKLKLCFL